MITVNIDALSISELRYIAKKEGIDDVKLMDREDLVETLKELYEERMSTFGGEGASYSPSTQPRFMNTIVEHELLNSVGPLPGVEPLPDFYPETRIYLLLKDPYWAHAYWSICPTDLQRLEHKEVPFEFFLRVSILKENSQLVEVDSFDIDVSREDTSWNINLPERGCSYLVSLFYRDEKGNNGLLSQSEKVFTPRCYWMDHLDKLQKDRACFTLLTSSLVTKGGVMVENPLLKEVADKLDTWMDN
ncbi:MAG: DUF4912 domain-containing protein [Sphaerochaetaceae bacterium]|jgi:hypothetical protein|nr:DUF4912 domain-containing protein [Spirochaetales bacterium]